MRRLLLVGGMLLAVTLSNGSMAADMPLKAPPAPIPELGWTEFYFGINIGYATGHSSWCTDADAANCLGAHPIDIYAPNMGGITNGGQFGYRWQIPGTPAVVGAEAMFGAATINTSGPATIVPTNTRYMGFNTLASATGQLGFAVGRLLAYGKGGWAEEEIDLDAQNTTTGADLNSWTWVNGWTAGGGLEYKIFTHFSLAFEYDYYQFNPSAISGTNTLGATFACAFCDFGATKIQAVTGRINIKLWPWGP